VFFVQIYEEHLIMLMDKTTMSVGTGITLLFW